METTVEKYRRINREMTEAQEWVEREERRLKGEFEKSTKGPAKIRREAARPLKQRKRELQMQLDEIRTQIAKLDLDFDAETREERVRLYEARAQMRDEWYRKYQDLHNQRNDTLSKLTAEDRQQLADISLY